MNADHDVILAAVRAGTVTYEQAADLFMWSQAGQHTGVSRDHFLVLVHNKFPTQAELAGAMRKYLESLPPELAASIHPKHFN